MIAEKWGLSRTDVDAFSARSHERAAAAQDAGLFADQIVPVTTPDGTVVSQDEASAAAPPSRSSPA